MGSQLTKIIGNFQTTLAANISAGGTTGTLSSANDKEGNALPAGKYCMIVNQGQSNEQHMIFDLSGVNMTNIVGVDHSGDVSVGALKDARINNPIKLTDFVNLLRIVEILNGISTLDGTSPMKYDAEPTISDRKQVIHAGYAQDLITGIMGTASDIAAGSTKMTKDQGSKPRAHSTYVREQNTPDMTLKVESFRGAFIDSIISFAGGNSPSFINPGFGGDITMPTNNPANGETVTLTINGTACVFTFVASIGSTAGNVLIGGNVAASRANLAALINAPGVTTANGVAFTGAQLTAMGLVNCTDDLSSNIFVRATSSTVTTFTMAETMAGAGNVVAVNTTKNRIDLLVLNGGALAIRQGTEAVSPTVPTPTTGDTVLVSVYNIPGETSIRDRSAALSGYIAEWYDFAIYRTDITQKYAIDGSASSTAYTANPTVAPSSLYDGLVVYVKIGLANTTTNPTLNVSSLSARTIVKGVNSALVVGDILAGQYCTFIYDLTNTRWVLQNPVATNTAPVSTPRVRLNTVFETAGRFTVAVTGAGVGSFNTSGRNMSTGGGVSGSSNTTMEVGGSVYLNDASFGTLLTLSDPGGGSNFTTFFGIGNLTVATSGVTFTGRHIGFKTVGTSLYATQADGTTETASSALTTVTNGDVFQLYFKINGTSSVDYYWSKNGGALSAATNLTTNIPSGTTTTLQWATSSNNTANGMSVTVYGASYER